MQSSEQFMKSQPLIEKFRPPIIKIKAIHSKNPYVIKQHRPLLPEEKYKPRTLDGYFILKMNKTQLPSEVITLDLADQNITKIDDENFQYFSNLIEINLSHNHLTFSPEFAKFENLEILNLQGNNITNIKVDLSNFQKLKVVNLSFNFLQEVDSLLVLNELKELNLGDNFIQKLPEDMNEFYLLEHLDLSGNQFSSDQWASEFFFSLATIQILKYLYISRNAFKGFHTEKLKQGDFQNLEILDMAHNLVDNQHNLICVRNFQNLKKVIISGNPFAEAKETEGLQIELNQRNGAQLENLKQTKTYLKKLPPTKKNIQFSNMVLLKNQSIKKEGKTYNLGVKLVNIKKTKKSQDDNDIYEEEEQSDNMFLTGTNEVNGKKARIKSSSFTSYDYFKQQANEILGTQKVYDNQLQIKQQYKMLKNLINKKNSLQFINNREVEQYKDKKYLKPTKASQFQRVNNEIIKNELSDINHEKALNQKLETLEKEINNSLDSIQ